MIVCLTMIVRNEAHVIRRCLDSVLPYVDRWCIVDTGSLDGTQQVIRDHLAHVPGELHERTWVDQQHNRNEAMQLARPHADYLLLIDADEYLDPRSTVTPDVLRLALIDGDDAYRAMVRYGSLEFDRTQLVSTKHDWRWVGTRHPYMKAEGAGSVSSLRGLRTIATSDGASWADPDKYKRHVVEMEAIVAAEPKNARAQYYLAQSYRDAKEPAKALNAYIQRAKMVGWAEETWSARYEAAKLRERLRQDGLLITGAYVAAFNMRPRRAEPLYRLARYLRLRKQYASALMFAKVAAELTRSHDRLFVEFEVYEWRALDELFLCAYYAGDLATATEVLPRLELRVPDSERARVAANRTWLDKA